MYLVQELTDFAPHYTKNYKNSHTNKPSQISFRYLHQYFKGIVSLTIALIDLLLNLQEKINT